MPKVDYKLDPNFMGNRDFHSTFIYDRVNHVWKFSGYKCVYCETTLFTNPTNTKHLKNCKGVSHKREKDEEEEPTLLNKFGEEWTPLDSNLKKTKKKRTYINGT